MLQRIDTIESKDFLISYDVVYNCLSRNFYTSLGANSSLPKDSNNKVIAVEPSELVGIAKRWQDGEVVDVIVETPDTKTLRIKLPATEGFIPGQYYNVRIPVEGRPRPIQRAYSVGSSPHPEAGIIDIGIKEMEGGLVSPILVRKISPGDHLQIRGPVGKFIWDETFGGPVILVAAGSGVVPLMSMIRYAVSKNLQIPMRLLFSSTDASHVIYGSELDDLEQKNPWLKIIHTFTRDPFDSRAQFHRRIDLAMVREVTQGLENPLAYICGPPEMVENVEQYLMEIGLEDSQIFSEKYD